MDWVRLGRTFRALRVEQRHTQRSLAATAGVSHTLLSRLEHGAGARMTGRTIEKVAEALGARATIRLDWHGEAIDRLLDAGHADLVDQVVALLRRHEWEVVPEATFAIGGERGAVDVLAWHAASRTVLIAEIKSVVPDIQGTLVPIDRKIRLAASIAGLHGWRPARVGVLLVIGDTRTSRRRVDAHRATFEARFPHRIVRIRAFMRDPGAEDALRGLWFMPFATHVNPRHRVGRARRAA